MGERLEKAINELVDKLGYRIAGSTVFEASTGMVLHEADPYGFLTAEDWAIDQAMSGVRAIEIVHEDSRQRVIALELKLGRTETEQEHSEIYRTLDAAWRRLDGLR